MVTYLYFAMAVINWDWYWFMDIPDWQPQHRVILILIATPSIAMDLFAIYEFKKNNTRAE